MNSDRPPQSSRAILHLEDSPCDAEIVRESLAKVLPEFRIDHAPGQREFEAFLRQNAYEVVLADYELPGYHAPAALECVRALAPGTPFICVSGAIAESGLVELVKQGATDYVRKDRLDSLPIAIQRALVEADERKARQAAEAALKESERLYQSLVENLPQCVFRKDAEGRLTFGNRQYCEFAGQPLEQLLGKTDADLYPPALAEKYRADDLRVMASGELRDMVEEHALPNGMRRYVHVLKTPLRDSSGRVAGVQGIFWDITERKLLTEERDITLAILNEINNCPDLRGLARQLTRLLQEWSGCEAVGLRLRSGPDFPYYETRGFPVHFVELENRLCLLDSEGNPALDSGGSPVLECMCGNVLCGRFDPQKPFFTAKGTFWSNGTTEMLRQATPADLQGRTRNRCHGEGYESVALIPLRSGAVVYGLLQFNDHRPGRFSPERIAMLERLADNLAIAIAHRKAQEETAHSEALLAEAQRLAHLGHWKREASSQHIWWSDEVYHIFGRHRDSFQPTLAAFLECVHPEDRPLVRRETQAAWRGERKYAVDHRILQPDGKVRHVHQRGEVLFDSDGQPLRMLGTVLDITERKAVEATMRQQAALLEVAHDAILVQDLKGQILFMNRAAEELTGWPFAETKDQRIEEVLRVPQAILWQSAWHQTLAKGSWVGELNLVNRQAKNLRVDSRWTLVRDEQNQPGAILLVNTDVTEASRLKTQFLRAQRLESIGILASGIAHDLNNILSPILMGLSMIKPEVRSGEGQSLVSMIQDSARRGADTVKQLLTFARGAESQKGVIQPRHLAKELGQLLQRTFPKNIQIYLDLGEKPWVIVADPSQLHQVLMNLCVNARDAMPQGGVLSLAMRNQVLDEAGAGAHPHAKAGPYVVFKVADNGGGIPPAHLERIFDPFYTTKPLGQGTGLGLSTALGIVENHGGFILVDSELGRGSTFSVYLPALPEAAPAVDSDASALAAMFAGRTLLIVDDEPAVLKVASSLLAGCGFKVLSAASAQDAFEQYQSHRGAVELLMTDLMMPFEDGQHLITKIRALDKNLPVLVMSGLATQTIKSELAGEGNLEILDKPFNADELLEKLRQLLPEKNAGR